MVESRAEKRTSALVPRHEARGAERWGKIMRLLRSLLWCAALGGFGLLALIFLVQNLHTEQLVFFGRVYVTNFALALAGAAVLGFLLALVLVVPSRIATALYARALERELGQLEQKVAQGSEQREHLLERQERLLLRYERLFADHGEMVAERDRLRAQLRSISAAMADRPARTSEGAAEPRPTEAPPARRDGDASLASSAAAQHDVAAGTPAAGSAVSAMSVTVLPAVTARPIPPAGGGDSTRAHTEARAGTGTGARVLLSPIAPPTPPRSPREPTPPPNVAAPLTPIVPAMDHPLVGAPTGSEAHKPQAAREVASRHHLSLDGVRVSLGRLQYKAARVRGYASAMYNEMHTALLARVHAIWATVSSTVRSYVAEPVARRGQDILRRVRLHQERGQTRQ